MAVSKQSLRVLFVINSLGRGGTERSLAELLPFLAAADIHPVIAFFQHFEAGVEQSVRDQGFDTCYINQRSLMTRVLAVRKLISNEKPDLIYTTLLESDLVGRLATAKTSIPIMSSLVSTPYSPVRRQDPLIRATKLLAVQQLDGWTARHLTTHFHAVSQTVKAAAVSDLHISAERVTIVERGRDSKRLGWPDPKRRKQARQIFGLGDRDHVLVNVGRQEYAKGQVYLLRALPELIRRDPSITLLIAGRRGSSTAELEMVWRRHNIGNHVRFLDHRDDVPELLAAADLFVFPSLYEGLPGAMIEAMALGLPVVASDIPPNREVVEDGRNALLVEPEQPALLAAAIERLLGDLNLARAFGTRSRQIFEERFTMERSAARMVDLFRKVATMPR